MSTLRQLLALCVALSATPLAAQERLLPVARIVIYPGDQIDAQMVEVKTMFTSANSETLFALSPEAVIGKVARRTILPGQAIPLVAVDNPRLITLGAQVKIVFLEDGMQIVAYGIAQQAGALGDLVRVRNRDSGLFVTGRVQADGSIRVSEG